MSRGWLWMLVLIAGPLWAGDAWVGEYRIRDARGERELTLVRGEARIEYRMQGEPIRVWRQSPDGLELRELHLKERRMVAYAPGDLRTLTYAPDWAQLSGLVDPALRARLIADGEASAFGQPVTRYRGTDAQGLRIELDWLEQLGLPVRYRIGRQRKDAAIELQQLTRMPAERAFTATEGLLEIDDADLGDMALDPIARDLHHAAH